MVFIVKAFTLLAGVGVLVTLFFIIGLTIASYKRKRTKVWIIGLVISILATLIFYAISFSSILQLYRLTSQ